MVHAHEVQIWTARPEEVGAAEWPALTFWLDSTELRRAHDFRLQADRRAYILVHALRRLAVATALAAEPAGVAFTSHGNGKPMLAGPGGQCLYFSHSRRRELVVCAATRIGPVGIDVESLAGGSTDLELLSGLVVMPEKHLQGRTATDTPALFLFYWTVLEAYWKAKGSGLSFSNPAIRCDKARDGIFRVSQVPGNTSDTGALAMPLASPAGSAITLVLDGVAADAEAGAIETSWHRPDFFSPAASMSRPMRTQSDPLRGQAAHW